MKRPRIAASPIPHSLLVDVLTLERLMTGPLVHLVYWCGLGVIVLGGFGVVGASIGMALREGDFIGWLLAAPVLVAGLLVVCGLAVIWRSFCEFYVVIVRLGEDVHALRLTSQIQVTPAPAPKASRTPSQG